MFKSICEEFKLVSQKRDLVILRGYYRYIASYSFKVRVKIRIILNTKNSFLKNLRIESALKKYGIEIGKNASIGRGLSMPHPIGIVIGKEVKIGEFCTIYQGVTIGKRNGEYPKIGDNVCIYPNSTIVGGVTIGNNVIIGAGSVVLKNVYDNEIIAGVPAKKIGGFHE